MITTDGKYHIKRYMATQVAQIAKAVAFGIGSSAPALTDKRLQFEIGRAPIDSISYNFLTDKIIFKAKIPEGLVGKITEVGLFSELANSLAGAATDRILTTFETDEGWDNTPVFSTTTSRIGGDSLRQSPAAGATITNALSTGGIDLSNYSSADKFVFAYNNVNTNTSSLVFRFKTDASNHFSFTVANPTAGYHFDEIAKGSMTVTGTPNWNSINTIEVATTSAAGVVGTIDLDGITMADVDTVNPNYVLVARQLEPSFDIVAGTVNEFEFPLGVTV